MVRMKVAAVAVLLSVLCVPQVMAAGESCDRACLKGVMDRYLDALVKHDPSALPMTYNIKYTENGVRLNVGEGMWQTAAARPTYRVDVIDEQDQQVGMVGRISENGNNNWYGVRLKVEPNRQVSQIEVLVNRSLGGGAGPGPATRANTEAHPLMMQEIPPDQRLPRARLAEISNAYFTGLDTTDSSEGVSFDPACQRRENGMIMASNPDAEKGSMQWLDCKTQFDTGFSVIVTDIRERRFEVVDPVTGLAFGWGYFDHSGVPAKFSRTLDHQLVDVAQTFRQPSSFYIAEVFKVVDGKIRQIEAVLTSVPYQMSSGW